MLVTNVTDIPVIAPYITEKSGNLILFLCVIIFRGRIFRASIVQQNIPETQQKKRYFLKVKKLNMTLNQFMIIYD